MKKHTRYLSIVLCLALVLSLLPGCGSDTATTIHLEKFQGTVGVADEKDSRLQPREGMQLYSGYEVGTAEVSKAWIGLDDTKSVKMDANTTAEVSQSGKDLKVTLQEGKLFFNVSQPLTEEETFTIETATMVTGIRGTSGWLEVMDDYTSRLVVLEGTVTVESKEPETGASRSIAVTGGQILTVVYYGDAVGYGREDSTIEGLIGDQVIISGNIIHAEDGLRVEQLLEANVPGFVQEEVAQSPAIQQKITEHSSLSVPEILESLNQGETVSDSVPGESADVTQEQVTDENAEEVPEESEAEEAAEQAAAQPPQTDTEEDIPTETVVTYEKIDILDPGSAGQTATEPYTFGSSDEGNTSAPSVEEPTPDPVVRPTIEVVYNSSDGSTPQYAIVTYVQENADGTVTVLDDPAPQTVPVEVGDNSRDCYITIDVPGSGSQRILVASLDN